jgi:hypothetical protein
MRAILLSMILMMLALGSWGQSNTSPSQRPQANAIAIDQAPAIDGDIMNDAIWSGIDPISTLQQTQPQYGSSVSELTDIRIAYTSSTLYISAICHDSNPERLVVNDARRDADLTGTDAIIFIFDTYKDGQNGFVFGTNSIGIEYDAQIDNEGVGNFNNNRQQGGTIGGVNLNWDAAWTVATQVGDYGWSAEFAIPLKTLRFSSGEQSWGMNVQRNISNNNEIAFWSLMPLNFDLNRVSLAGSLHGLNLKSQGNLKAIPYVLAQSARDFNTSEEYQSRVDAGLDIKYSVTPALTLDLTYNTDFAQVEVDDQQINLDRFNLFFPEKRPFFLENAGQFSVGSPGEVDLFFSRRIGLSDNGSPVPIIGGARLSGKLNQTNVGLLSMFTEEVTESSISANNFNIGRVNHEFQNTRSSLGAAFISRNSVNQIEGIDAPAFNHTYAIDGQLGFGKKADVSGFASTTRTDGVTDGNHAFQLIGRYNWNGWLLRLGYTEVSETFNPEVGFLGRTAFRKAEGLIFYNKRFDDDSVWLEWRPHVSYRGYWNFQGFQETGFLHVDNHWVLRNLFEFHTGINFTREGVSEAFEISGTRVDPGTYDHQETQIVFITNPNKPVSFTTRHFIGGFFGGRRSAHSGTINGRIGDQFNGELNFSYNDISLPNGDFIADVYSLRLSYSFTPRIFVQSLVQYNGAAELWSTNARLGWLQAANTGLFIVYNETSLDGLQQNRSITLKYSYLFDVLR